MKNIFFTLLIFLTFFSNSIAQIEMNSSGNIGIGLAPKSNYKLSILGNTELTGQLNVGYLNVIGYVTNGLEINGDVQLNDDLFMGHGSYPHPTLNILGNST